MILYKRGLLQGGAFLPGPAHGRGTRLRRRYSTGDEKTEDKTSKEDDISEEAVNGKVKSEENENGMEMLALGEDASKGKVSVSQTLLQSLEEGYEAAGVQEKPEGYTKSFLTKRLMVFVGLVIGYSSFYITRNSFIYTAPVMVEAGVIDMAQV